MTYKTKTTYFTMDDSLKVIQSERMLEVLIELLDSPGILRSKLYTAVMANGAGKPTLIKRVNELINENLVNVVPSETHKSGQHLYLTDEGIKLAKLALEMRTVRRGECQPADDDICNITSLKKHRVT